MFRHRRSSPVPGFDRPVGTTGRKRVQTTKVRSTVGWAIPRVVNPASTRAPSQRHYASGSRSDEECSPTAWPGQIHLGSSGPVRSRRSMASRWAMTNPSGVVPSARSLPNTESRSVTTNRSGVVRLVSSRTRARSPTANLLATTSPSGVVRSATRKSPDVLMVDAARSRSSARRGWKAPGRTVQGFTRENLKPSTKGTKTFKSSASKDRKLRSARNTRSKFNNRNSRRNKSNRRGRRR